MLAIMHRSSNEFETEGPGPRGLGLDAQAPAVSIATKKFTFIVSAALSG
jgi:hypothetical protein